MSSKPSASIHIPSDEVEKVRGGIAGLIAKLTLNGIKDMSQSALYRAMATGGEIVKENGRVFVKFAVGEES